jgi:hypothetical protein
VEGRVVRRLTKEGINKYFILLRNYITITTIMAKTYCRRHRRANRTRRGGVKHSKGSSPRAASASAATAALALAPAAAASAASAASPPAATHADLAAIFKRVNVIAAQATPQKISKRKTKSALDIQRDKLNNILAGKATHSKGKSSFRPDSFESDSRLGQTFVHNGK